MFTSYCRDETDRMTHSGGPDFVTESWDPQMYISTRRVPIFIVHRAHGQEPRSAGRAKSAPAMLRSAAGIARSKRASQSHMQNDHTLRPAQAYF